MCFYTTKNWNYENRQYFHFVKYICIEHTFFPFFQYKITVCSNKIKIKISIKTTGLDYFLTNVYIFYSIFDFLVYVLLFLLSSLFVCPITTLMSTLLPLSRHSYSKSPHFHRHFSYCCYSYIPVFLSFHPHFPIPLISFPESTFQLIANSPTT